MLNQSILWLHFSNWLRQFHNLYVKCKLTLLRFTTSLLVLLSNGQVEDCHYLPANDIWVPLIWVSKVLSAMQPLMQRANTELYASLSSAIIWHICVNSQVWSNVWRHVVPKFSAGAERHWHRRWHLQTCQLKPLVLDNLCPLARIHPACQQAPWYLNRPGEQYI